MSFLNAITNKTEDDSKVVTQNVAPVTQIVDKEKEENKKKQYKKKEDTKKPTTTRNRTTKKKILTDEMVYNYIKDNRKKRTGLGTLWAVINRHKAIDIAILNDIIDIKRKFEDCL